MKLYKVFNIKTTDLLTIDERNHYNNMIKESAMMGCITKFGYQKAIDDTNLNFNEHVKKLENCKQYKKECTELKKVKLSDEQIEIKKAIRNKHNFTDYQKRMNEHKSNLNQLIKKSDVKEVRKVTSELNEYKKVYIGESDLTRTVDADDIVIVSKKASLIKLSQIKIFESVVKNGFYIDDKKFVFFTSSAGQVRNEKAFFIAESVFNNEKIMNKLTNGLSIEKINQTEVEKGKFGCNTNKYLTYLALTTTSSTIWDEVDLDRVCVVDDFETILNTEVDYIDNETFEIKRQKMDVPIPHADGCGMVMPHISRKNIQIRGVWLKGLLTSISFQKFVKEFNGKQVIQDIYGKSYNINDLDIILTKSQFKMWKYYKDWDDYKQKFKDNGCTFNICNAEEKKADFKQATLSYQMLQTLDDMSDRELKTLVKKDVDYIDDIYSNQKEQMKFVCNGNPTIKKILDIYPNFTADEYYQKILRDKITAMRKNLLKGKVSIGKSRYTYIVPDVIAWCEWLFLDIKNPEGVLKNGEVHCSLFDYEQEVDCLRSPHYYKEHAIRKNVEIPMKYRKYFQIANGRQLGLYTSIHDPMSKLLMYDEDGDKSLIVCDDLFVKIAKRNTKNVVPLYYEMGKADPKILNNDEFFKGLKVAFKYNKIGNYSNYLTAEWNTSKDLEVLKVLTSMGNYSIDASKTLEMKKPKKDSEIYAKIQKTTSKNKPYFFKYVKEDYKNKELTREESTMNRLVWHLENEFKNSNGKRYEIDKRKFNYKEFLNNKSILGEKNIKGNEEKYKKAYEYFKEIRSLVEKSAYQMDEDDKCKGNIYKQPRNDLKEYAENNDFKWGEFSDCVIARYFKNNKDSVHKKTILELFSDEIIKNLIKNVK